MPTTTKIVDSKNRVITGETNSAGDMALNVNTEIDPDFNYILLCTAKEILTEIKILNRYLYEFLGDKFTEEDI